MNMYNCTILENLDAFLAISKDLDLVASRCSRYHLAPLRSKTPSTSPEMWNESEALALLDIMKEHGPITFVFRFFFFFFFLKN